MKHRIACVLVMLGGIAGCHGNPSPSAGMASATQAEALAQIPDSELRDVLAGMARAHGQKIQLAWWASTPLRPVDGAFRPFFEKMGTEQKGLLADVQAWAKEHRMDLAYQFSPDTAGRALKIMEDRQEKLVRGDGKEDFQRDILMQMYNDYEWQISQIQALLPKVTDAGLRAYLEKSLKVHEEGSAEAMGLLKRYRFGG
jgi:hypothetical protein